MINWNSKEYWEGIYLRNLLLKTSAGEPWITELPWQEREDIHLVALLNNKVVGTMLLSKIANKTVQAKQVAVSQAYQGFGIGKQLLNFAEEIALFMGIKTIFLTGRKQAWIFYELMGYQSMEKSYIKGNITLKKYYKNIEQINNQSIKQIV